MWKCHKCGKPVYFAERKQSLGYDWHPECLRCEECGKRLNPGQHAEHKGVPYCHVPCYGALFGPQLFGHGTRVESHKSFGNKALQKPGQQNGPSLPRDGMESKIKVYNQFYDNKSMEVRSREVNNRLILEGALRVYWGVQAVIHLKEDDDQRTFVVRKRNSCRVSKAENDASDKENNDATDSYEAATTTSDQVDAISTDVSLSESMTFDSCSLNEYPELPTTPEEVSAQTTGASATSQTLTNGQKQEDDSSSTTTTLCDEQSSNMSTVTTATNGASSTLPSKLDKLKKLDWDEIDDLLQVERRVNEKDKVYETMPVRLPSASPQNSSSSTPTSDSSKTISNQISTDSTNIEDASHSKTSSSSTTTSSPCSSSSTTTSSDNFLTATASLNTTTNTETTTNANTTTSTTVDNYETSDDATLKAMDFEDFKRSVHQDYVNGSNSFQEHADDTLKRNQPIDPSRIHDSLKLYPSASGDNPMSKSFNCEHALRSINASYINDTLSLRINEGGSPQKRSPYVLQKSGSAQAQLTVTNGRFERGINRSKSGPSCIVYSSSDDDDDSTLKTRRRDGAGDGDHISATIRKSDIPPRFIQIKMNCYPKEGVVSDCDSSRHDNPQSTSQSGAAGGDELTQTEELFTTSGGDGVGLSNHHNSNHHHQQDGDEQPLHITEDGVVLRRPPRTGAAAIKRRSGNRRSRTKLKRRCSINGHFYNRETSFFTPPYGSQMSVWVTSLVTTQEVINLLLEKYRVDSAAENFSLFIMRDNGEQKRLKDNEYPLITRIMLGPHEDVAKLFLVDAKKTDEISNEVAQFLNLSLPECRAIIERYDQELDREVAKVKEKYAELSRRIVGRMESLKVHL